MTRRLPVAPSPGPLEEYAARFDDLFRRARAQREGFRRYLEGLLLPAERNKTLTALANTELVAGAQRKVAHVSDSLRYSRTAERNCLETPTHRPTSSPSGASSPRRRTLRRSPTAPRSPCSSSGCGKSRRRSFPRPSVAAAPRIPCTEVTG